MYKLEVDKMSCGHCVATVTRAVKALDSDAKVDIDLASRQVKIDTDAELDEVREAIAAAGYPVLSAA
ncbi:heavy-metal-associated domain-containing protein [Massilia endophytica]|uniref:heavy-metal-associated domain-containing protein n=1 Tax=Massilia endophytica TaxID=2899220 RepID=UPI001E456E73|nr:heavy-metal-associated domain-containing protein [Massilia endophytica]UGQ45001.1 heavy-metal-associated domain-containing protein [Massilia endophytica]